ncbi:MAG: response regulator [Desulfovibrionaceae bacterium]|nr:response regulator [Desulfovibrionaceae bacterium]MBF0513956.1 response regulator [Desulfovibrionaceae bacterium]
MRALIVEDDPVSRKHLEFILAPYAACETAEDGAAAVKAYHDALKKRKPFHLICMDILLPGMDGHQALEQIRQIEAKRGLPPGKCAKAFMVSAHNEPKNVSRSFFQGQALTFISKPYTEEEIVEELKKFGLVKDKPVKKSARAGKKTEAQ